MTTFANSPSNKYSSAALNLQMVSVYEETEIGPILIFSFFNWLVKIAKFCQKPSFSKFFVVIKKMT